MKKLNLLEQTILENILEDNKKEYPFLLTHLPHLRVKSREYTGVGMYSNFEYAKPIQDTLINAPISSSKRLIIKGLKNELSYEINITNGKIDFLEIVTNGDELWDGNFEEFRFESAF